MSGGYTHWIEREPDDRDRPRADEGNYRGCGEVSGWFVVDRITYAGNTPTAIELRFEQHCDLRAPSLHGAIRWSQ